MSLNGAYDEANVFAKILRDEMPAVKVWEDNDVLAFMDVFPQSRGHVLVVHKRSKARNILEIEPDNLGDLIMAVQKISHAVAEALAPDGITIMQFNGEAGGQTVFHLHFHVIPRWDGQSLGRHGGGMADMDELRELAGMIAAAVR